MTAVPQPGDTYLAFNGRGAFAEVPSLPCYSVDYSGNLTVAAWVRIDAAEFPRAERGYVHWLGKGKGAGPAGQQEWAFRAYDLSAPAPQRASFYVFNPEGGLGVGSFVAGPVQLGAWRLLAASVDSTCTFLYCDGAYVDCDTYRGPQVGRCRVFNRNGQQVQVCPRRGNEPLRLGTQDCESFLQGGLTRVRIWNRVLTSREHQALYDADAAPRDGLSAEFLLNSETGDVVNDSAIGNTGVLLGASWAIQE